MCPTVSQTKHKLMLYWKRINTFLNQNLILWFGQHCFKPRCFCLQKFGERHTVRVDLIITILPSIVNSESVSLTTRVHSNENSE